MEQPFQIIGDLGVYYEQIAVSLGFVTLLASLLTFTSCRSFASLIRRYTSLNIDDNKFYRSFYRYHAYYWWSFFTTLVAHMMSAGIHTDLLPDVDDPDALAHWMILGFALGALVSILIQFSSCRTFTSLIGFFTNKSPLKLSTYKSFYGLHAYYWYIFLIVIAGHIIASSIHTNIWPR